MSTLTGIMMREPLLFFAKAVELAGPGVVVSGGKLHLLGQLPLQVLDGAGEVASSHAELDGDIAAAAFVIDHERAVSQVDIGDGAERHLSAIGSRDQNLADRLRRIAKFRRITHGKVEAPVAIDDLRDRCAADRGLNDVVYILRLQAESGRLGSVDRHQETGLTGDIEDSDIGNSWHLAHDGLNLIGQASQFVEVLAEQLQRILALDARHRLFHVVLNGLRKIEVDAGVPGEVLLNSC